MSTDNIKNNDGMFTPAWYDEMWGKIVVGIGAGTGKSELIGILMYVAREQFDKGVDSQKNIGRK